MKTVFRNLMAASLAGRHVRGNQLAHSATYDRRAPMAAPHWIQCATDTTRPGAMVRAATVPGGWPAPLAWAGRRMMVAMKAPRRAAQRHLPGSPFSPPARA